MSRERKGGSSRRLRQGGRDIGGVGGFKGLPGGSYGFVETCRLRKNQSVFESWGSSVNSKQRSIKARSDFMKKH